MPRTVIKHSKDLGHIVRSRRKALKLTQKELVEIAPFGATFYSNLENGKESAELNKSIEAVRMLGLRLIIEVPEEQAPNDVGAMLHK